MSTQTEGAPEVKEEPAARVPVPSPEKVVTFKVSSPPRVSPPSPPKIPPLSPEKLGMDEAWVETEGERVRAVSLPPPRAATVPGVQLAAEGVACARTGSVRGAKVGRLVA